MESLTATIMSLFQLDVVDIPNFQLVIVDNGSTDDTGWRASEMIKVAPFPVTLVLENRLGLSAARNRGIEVATGDLILFTDDDCLVTVDWAKTAANLFSDGLLKIIGGRVELYNKDDLPLAIKTSLVREELTSIDRLFGFLHGANMAFGRAVVDRLGTFDTRLGAGTYLRSAEDAEFVYRAIKNGIPVIYEPTLIVHHNHGRSGSKVWYRAVRDHAIGAGAMMMKYLMVGQTDLLRPIFWDFQSALRRWRRDPKEWRWVLAKRGLFEGAFRFIYSASWRSPR
jgi:glycosyltransferase involved in cell wall biosynthesis